MRLKTLKLIMILLVSISETQTAQNLLILLQWGL